MTWDEGADQRPPPTCYVYDGVHSMTNNALVDASTEVSVVDGTLSDPNNEDWIDILDTRYLCKSSHVDDVVVVPILASPRPHHFLK